MLSELTANIVSMHGEATFLGKWGVERGDKVVCL